MSDNPYLPPTAETDVPDAPQAHGWFVKDGYLHVEPNAQLPMIDLFTGETAERMILHSIKVTRFPFWLIGLIWIAIALCLASIALSNTPFVKITGPFAFLTVMASAIGAILSRSFTLKVLFTRESSRKISLLSLFGTILGFVLLLLFLAQFQVFNSRSGAAKQALVIAFVVAIAVRFSVPLFFRKLTCRRSFGTHQEIRGVHPAAIERLRELRQG